ncbi:MAG: aldo/keto reductase [Anaeroplasmataceae bacterium]|nr:aldo/keto reductase [Anaeroplasmataceae bacterium]MDE6414603.1 aldo/keto reductase [Anaeroplasmataceae bacterium]
MKKIIEGILFLLLFFCFTACKAENPNDNPENKEDNDLTKPSIDSTSSILIAYFSCTNTTKSIASLIAEETKGVLYEITPKIPYTEEDLKYYTNGRADQEQADSSIRPEINGSIENISTYETLFLGYPIWHGQAPRILSTFLESYDLSNKTIIPFCTSHSSGIGSSDTALHSLAPKANWMTGKRFPSGVSKQAITEWIETLQLTSGSSVSSFNLEKGINGCAPTVKLNSGYEMPILGLGTYSLHGDTCKTAVLSAIHQGYRLIDTAYMYGNEIEIGEAIRESNVPREQLFVITKIYPGEQFLHPEQAIQEALDRLNIEYIDMMLLHHPGNNDIKAYKAMEKFVEQGKIRSLGLSNWYIEEIDDFISQVSIIPALIQNEIHPYYQEQNVVPYMHKLGIVMQAWYPLGGRGHTAELLADPTISSIAKAHNKSSAQVILRWHLQRGVVAIPGSSNPQHILENISIFDFKLSTEEMHKMAALERNEKHDWY